MIGSMAKGRFTFTTRLTPRAGRGPPAKDGRRYAAALQLSSLSNSSVVVYCLKVEQFYGITQPAALIIPQNPRRNLYGPMRVVGGPTVEHFALFLRDLRA